jgi:ABC-type antimicrobial peptide transport system permease subunit
MGVARMVLREGGIMAVVGIAAGLVVAWAGTRFLGALLYEVSPLSVVEFAAGVLVIGTVTLVATLLPARRASRTDPALVLRGE